MLAPTKQPQLGSLAIQAPANTPQIIHVSPSTCHDLSLFKEILREYRRLDDTIVMRLNRANAVVRDQERIQDVQGTATVQEQACSNMWRELVGNWNRRAKLVEYCAYIADQSLAEKQKTMEDKEGDPAAMRRTQASIFADDVKRNQIKNELTIESIVRRRSMDAFKSRCQYFIPPMSDVEARKMWDSAQ